MVSSEVPQQLPRNTEFIPDNQLLESPDTVPGLTHCLCSLLTELIEH